MKAGVPASANKHKPATLLARVAFWPFQSIRSSVFWPWMPRTLCFTVPSRYCNSVPCVTYPCAAENYEGVDPWESIAFPDARDAMPTNQAGSLAQPKRSFKACGASHLRSTGTWPAGGIRFRV